MLHTEDGGTVLLRTVGRSVTPASRQGLAAQNNLTFNTAVRIPWAGIAQSVQRLATGWTVRGSNLSGGDIFSTSPWPTQPSIQWVPGLSRG